MDQLFGRPEGREELTSIENGLIMSFQAEKRIANGRMVLVPIWCGNGRQSPQEQKSTLKINGFFQGEGFSARSHIKEGTVLGQIDITSGSSFS